MEKSSLMAWGLNDQEILATSALFGIQFKNPSKGLKYLGFNIKAIGYKKIDWAWLLSKVEKIIHSWCNRWLSRARRLVLLKSVH
jgi:hypothetical protein